MFGVSLAVLFLNLNYQTAASGTTGNEKYIVKTFISNLENKSDLQNFLAEEGLYRIDDQLYNISGSIFEDDTLFVTFQNNESAWQHFTVLSEIMQDVYSANKTSHPVSLAIRLLTDFSKVYLSVNTFTLNGHAEIIQWLESVIFNYLQYSFKKQVLLPDSPPPENI